MTLATEQIWKAFITKMRRFVSARVSNPDDAEDIVQDIFLKLHARLGTLRDRTRLVSWLYRIANNAIVDYYRTRHQPVPLPKDLAVDGSDDQRVLEKQISKGLLKMVEALPEKFREALVLSELEGLPQRALAKQLGITLSGAKSRVQRGRALLRSELLACCHFEFDRRGGLVDSVPRSRCCDACQK